jgi:hypothetical protein
MFWLAYSEDSEKCIIKRSYLSGYAIEWTKDYEVQIKGEIKFQKSLADFEKDFGQPLKVEYAIARVKELCMRNNLYSYICELRLCIHIYAQEKL